MFNPTLTEEEKILVKSLSKQKKMRGQGKVKVYFNKSRGDGKGGTYYTGTFHSKKSHGSFTYRSSYELRHFINLENDPKVVSFHSEIMEVPYKDSKNKNRVYIPDLVVVYEDGKIEIHEIKPKAMLQDVDVQKKAQACRAFATKTFEQKVRYKFITEAELFSTNKEYIDFINNVCKKWNKGK